MLLIFFIFILFLSIAFYFTGGFIESPPMQIAGSVFIFVLGSVLMLGGVVYQSGHCDVYVYGSNFTGDSPHWDSIHPSEAPDFNPSTDPIYLFGINRTVHYKELGTTTIVGNIDVENLIGFLLSVAGIFGFISIMINLGRFGN